MRPRAGFRRLEIPQFFNGQSDVSSRCGHAHDEEDDGQPRSGIHSSIKVASQPEAEKYRQGHLEPKTAVIRKVLDVTPVSFFQNQFIKLMRIAAAAAPKVLSRCS